MKNRLPILCTVVLAFYCGEHALAADAAPATPKETLKAADMRFIKRAAASPMIEGKLAEMAVKKAARAEVRSYAGRVVADHAKTHLGATALAKAKGVDVAAPVEPADAKALQQLGSLNGPDFDTRFLAEMVTRHKSGVGYFQDASTVSRDSEVKAFASATLPTLTTHLKMAVALSPKIETPVVPKEPDNTARNSRDRAAANPTPLDQGNSKSDTEITAQIRKGVIAAKGMSLNAQNVKIITLNGKVTLRGPVNSAEEKRVIDEIATRTVRADRVDSQLEVK